jgi:hypothetical protein
MHRETTALMPQPIRVCHSMKRLSVPLRGPVAPVTMLALAVLAPRLWTATTGITLQSKGFF